MFFNELEIKILVESSKTTGLGGFASRSCARHLERALELRANMPEVAAVFAALRKRRYINANFGL